MSHVIRDLFGYKFSNDYEQLWWLAQKQSVACRVTYSDNFFPAEVDLCQDICQTIFSSLGVSVSVRGCSYISAETLKEFIVQCKRSNLEWIVPHGAELTQASKGVQP